MMENQDQYIVSELILTPPPQEKKKKTSKQTQITIRF